MTHHQEFLQDTEPSQEQARRSRTRIVRTLFLFFFVLLALWVVSFITASVYVTTQLFEARDSMVGIREAVGRFSFGEAKEETQAAQASLDSARSVLPFIRSASWLPLAGIHVDTFADVITASEALLEAFDPVIELGSDLMRLAGLSEEYLREVEEGVSPEVTFDDLSTETKRAVLQRLSASADELDLFLVELAILEEEMSLLSASVQLEPLLAVLDPLMEDLQVAQEPLQLLSIVARLLPGFAGLEESSSILLLFMNSNELRPGGGFIGSYGVLEMSGGDIAHLETADVYALDRAVEDAITREAPEPLSRYNATTHWFFRDSNWSADFAVSSAQAIELFLEEVGFLDEGFEVPATKQVDHLIGFTPTYASDLLAITGPITVGGQTFTAENVADLLEYQVQYGYAASGVPEAQRKEILADLVNEVKTRLYALPSASWSSVLEVTLQALAQKQLLLFSTDEAIQNMLQEVGWAGSVDSTTVDTLMVVDANLASLKSDPVVARDVTYEIYQNASEQWIGRVAIHYKHNGTFDWKTTRYRTYTRVYVPMGTEFLSVEGSWLNDKTQNPTKAKGSVDIVNELGLTSFGTFTSVEPGEESILTFEFVLAQEVGEAIESDDYTLTVLKQAGAQNNALTLDLDFGKNVTHATPGEDSDEWGDDVYRLNTILDQDLEIHVEL
ncbi:DUF4012 domain-containing protein [Candidatus Uhrbacteria bacterium]|nr:DUF4012 domain-containing protein [Candidatus Uhrbacteria bacterium]MBI4592564.1 DUF4012 domain-containing protein [Candidatus Uhrbacteria bacterium]